MLFAVCLLGALCATGANGISSDDSHPIGKLVKMIEGLREKVIEEGKTEELEHVKFLHWYKRSSETLKDAITNGKEETAKLKDKIEAANTQKAALQDNIDTLKGELDNLDGKQRKATKDRESTAKLYKLTSEDLKSTIDSMKDAIKAIKASNKDSAALVDVHDGAVAALLESPHVHAQLKASADIDSPHHSLATEFLAVAAGSAANPDMKSKGDYDKHVKPYTFKSGSVIELLKDLQANFEQELLDATKTETNSLNDHEQTSKALSNMVSSNSGSKKEKEGTVQDLEGDLAQWKSDLKSAEADLAADVKTEADTDKTYATRVQEWKERTEVRKEEVEAMTEAIGILEKRHGVQTAPPRNPVPPAPPASATSFLQILAPRDEALNLLRTAAQATNSDAMRHLAAVLAKQQDGPFDTVNNMIQNMIFRLQDEQKQEDTHKDWCDQEIAKTITSEKTKADKVDELMGKLDSTKARLQKATAKSASNGKMIAALTSFMKEAEEVRQIGRKENSIAIKEAQQAQQAIADATVVLKRFYKKAGALDFVQRSAAPVDLEEPAPEMKQYKGTPKATDIMSLLETAASEFAKMEADTKAQEVTDEEEYDKTMKDTRTEKARRVQDFELANVEKQNLVEKIALLDKSRANMKSEHLMVKQYMKDLQPACVEGGSSYKDRKAARAQETEALRQAQAALEGAFKEEANRKGAGRAFLEVRKHAAIAQ